MPYKSPIHFYIVHDLTKVLLVTGLTIACSRDFRFFQNRPIQVPKYLYF
jgi:hypothetical protein